MESTLQEITVFPCGDVTTSLYTIATGTSNKLTGQVTLRQVDV